MFSKSKLIRLFRAGPLEEDALIELHPALMFLSRCAFSLCNGLLSIVLQGQSV